MARGDGSWRHWAVLWAGMLALTTALAVIALALRSSGGLQTAAQVAQLVSVALVIPTLAVPLWLWSRRSPSPAAATTQDVAKSKDVLAGIVDRQWRTEAVMRSLDDPDPIPVQWRLTWREVMDHPANLTPASLLLTASSGDISTLAGEFRTMRRPRLVILGGPGTGKTTLAVQLLLELLATRHGERDEPIPVLLSVAGWDTDAFPLLHDWLTVRLAQDYPALRATGLGLEAPAVLATHGQILPVLDGLDELPLPAQAAVITALNRSVSGVDQFIVTSRTTDYLRAIEAAGDVLTSAVVIEPEPLDPTAAAGYLDRCLPPRSRPMWEPVLTHLRTTPALPSGGALADVAATPLGLWLLRAVYITPGTDPAALLAPGGFADAASLRAHLFDQLIGALVDTRPPSNDPAAPFRPHRRHDAAQVQRWLGFLAHHLTHVPAGDGTAGTQDLVWWQLARTTHTLTRTTRLTMAMTIALVIASTSMLLSALANGLTDALTNGLGYGSASGLAAGLTVGFAARSWSQEPPGFADLRVRGLLPGLARGLVRASARALAASLAVGLAMGLTVGFTVEPTIGLAAGLATGLAVGLAYEFASAFTAWAETPTPQGQANTPLTSWRADRTLNLTRVATIGLAGGLMTGLVTGLTAGLSDSLAFGLVVGITSGLAVGITFGLAAGDHHAWMAYLIATNKLARAGRLPRALMSFLDDAHRLGLLRAVGPIYQFRHAELQDHLAATYHPAG